MQRNALEIALCCLAAATLWGCSQSSLKPPSGDPFYDCNHNGVADAVDIAQGSSADANGNGIPDECETG